MIQRMREFLRKWLGETENGKSGNVETNSGAADSKRTNRPMLRKLEDYLMGMYDFRFNVLTEQPEYRNKGEGMFAQVDQRMLNTLCMDAREQGINCWDKDVSRLLLSKRIADFHPFRRYMEGLPEWDGKDRVAQLAMRISDSPLWVEGFHRWMLGMAAQWMGMDGQCANAIAPLLVSTEQGRCKSTFCQQNCSVSISTSSTLPG